MGQWQPFAAATRVTVAVCIDSDDGAARESVASVLDQGVEIDLLVFVGREARSGLNIPEWLFKMAPEARVEALNHDAPEPLHLKRAASLARGDWLAVLGRGDRMHPERLAKLVNLALAKELDFVADDVLFFGSHQRPRAERLFKGDAAKHVLHLKAPNPFGWSQDGVLRQLHPLCRVDALIRLPALTSEDGVAGPWRGLAPELLAAGYRGATAPAMTYFARARRRGTLLPVRPELATTQSESDAASVCIISRQRLTGRITGSSTYLIDLVAALSQAGFVPHLLHPSPLIFGRTPIFRLTPDMDVFRTVDVRAGIKAGPWFIATNPVVWIEAVRGATALALQRLRLPYRWIAARPAPYSIAAPWTAQDKLYVARRAPAISRAGVVLDYLFQTEALPYLSNQPPSAIVMHDLLHARAKDFASQGLNDTVGTVDGNTEAAKLSLADAVIAIQPADAAWVRQNVPGVAVLEAPFAATMSPCVQPGDDDVLLFVGSNTAPNIIGLTWFLDEIWPIILAQRNTAILKVAGAVTRSFGGHAYKQVEFLGIVPDLGPVYAQSGIVISPLTLGSGLKVKLVEALGAGKACVVTSVTLQGVEDVTKSAVRLADTPTAFADAVLSMVADRTARADLAERALRCAREQFSTAGYVELIDWLTKGRRLEG